MKNKNQKEAAVSTVKTKVAEKSAKKVYQTRPKLIANAKVNEQRLLELEAEIFASGERISHFKNLNTNLERSVKELKSVKSSLTNEKSRYTDKINELETIIAEQRDDISGWKSIVAKQDAKKDSSDRLIQSFKNKAEYFDELSFFQVLLFAFGTKSIKDLFFPEI